jgi:AraC-like DNA-binding protein
LSGLRGIREDSSDGVGANRTYLRSGEAAVVPAALEEHVLFSTGDPASAERLGTPFLGRHRLTVQDGDPKQFRATLHALVTGPITLGHLHVGSAAVLELAASAPRFLVVERVGEGTAVVVQPGQPTRMDLPAGSSHLVVGIERQPLLVHLGRLLGRALDRPLVFDVRMDVGAAHGRRWNLAVEMLQTELADEDSLLRSGIGPDQLVEFLMSSLLYGQRSNYSALLSRPASGPERRATTAAKQFIEMNLSDRLTLADVASAAGVSVRTLQEAFRTELRTTPVAYIRSRRLDRARAELADDVAAGSVTVTDVATRWGITHLGRFACEYRDRFGESPSQTLRRHRQGR